MTEGVIPQLGRACLPALYVSADAINTQNGAVMGRQSAGLGFLRGFPSAFPAARGDALVDRSRASEPEPSLSLICPQATDFKMSVDVLRQAGWQSTVQHLSAARPAQWQGFDVLHYPAPLSDQLGWQRARHGGMTAFALSGVTHTISSARVMQQLAAYVHGPFTGWDALVCTSQSVQRAVHGIWQEQQAFLAWRLGKTVRPAMPMTPVIPLGVHADDFVPDGLERMAGRVQWGLEPDEVVVLFVGRLSLHAKANPLPMYLACARAAARSGRKIRLLECGWFANEAIKATFDQAAHAAGVRVTRVDGREPGVTRRAYASADVFMSLSDNIQETFGLTPIEAMAAGLPVVVSNWDGYRETVRDGVDGFLIETRQPEEPACAEEFIRGYEDEQLSYDLYVAYAHVLVSVDVDACTEALVRLAQDADLRQRMGAAGRARAREVYDWSVVMTQYRGLWDEQAERLTHERQRKTSTARLIHSNPGMPNPLRMFAHYPSDTICAETLLSRVQRVPGPGVLTAQQARSLGMWAFSGSWLPSGAWLETALQALPLQTDSEMAANRLGQPMPIAAGMSVQAWAKGQDIPLPRAQRVAAWLHKVGLVHLSAPPAAQKRRSSKKPRSSS